MNIELGDFQLRSFRPEDATSLVQSADDSRVAANLRDLFPNPYTLRDAEEWLEIACNQEPETSFALAEGSAVIGGIGLTFQEDVHAKSAELGYWLGVNFWGRGIATRAVHWITRHGFEHFDLLRIYATVNESNPASVRVLEKSGFHFEGCLRQAVFKNGRVQDSLMYSLLRDEIEPRNPTISKTAKRDGGRK